MPRVITYLDDTTLKNLKEVSKTSGKTISKISAELIKIGYDVKHNKEVHKLSHEEEKKQELIDNHTEYLLKILSIVGDTYRCVRNEKSKYSEEAIEDVIKTITSNNRKYINGYLGRGET